MISLDEAYKKVFIDIYPDQHSEVCIEDKTHYIFVPRPNSIPDNKPYFTGTIFPAVNKKTGAIEEFNMANGILEHPKKHKLKIGGFNK